MNISSVTALIMDATAAAFQFNFEMNGRARNPRQRAGRKRPVPVTIDFYGPNNWLAPIQFINPAEYQPSYFHHRTATWMIDQSTKSTMADDGKRLENSVSSHILGLIQDGGAGCKQIAG